MTSSLTFVEVDVPRVLGDVAWPCHTDGLTGAQRSQADRGDAGDRDQALSLIQAALWPELVSYGDYLNIIIIITFITIISAQTRTCPSLRLLGNLEI